MLLGVLQDVKLFRFLCSIDQSLSDQVKDRGCPICGGRLDRAYYRRKPRGAVLPIPDECCMRLGLCCGRDGCRKRTLPPSCLFLGRKVYFAAVVLVVTTLRQETPPRVRVRQLVELLQVSPKTIYRWIEYFQELFPSSAMWTRLRGLVSPGVRNDALPRGLVLTFVSSSPGEGTGLIRCLYFLATGEMTLPVLAW